MINYIRGKFKNKGFIPYITGGIRWAFSGLTPTPVTVNPALGFKNKFRLPAKTKFFKHPNKTHFFKAN